MTSFRYGRADDLRAADTTQAAWEFIYTEFLDMYKALDEADLWEQAELWKDKADTAFARSLNKRPVEGVIYDPEGYIWKVEEIA